MPIKPGQGIFSPSSPLGRTGSARPGDDPIASPPQSREQPPCHPHSATRVGAEAEESDATRGSSRRAGASFVSAFRGKSWSRASKQGMGRGWRWECRCVWGGKCTPSRQCRDTGCASPGVTVILGPARSPERGTVTMATAAASQPLAVTPCRGFQEFGTKSSQILVIR